MLPSPSAALVALSLLAAPLAAAGAPPLPACEVGVRHIELAEEATGQAPEVCIRPGLSTSLFFDSKLTRVEVEGRERLRRMVEGVDALTLVPSEALADGDRILVTVHFEAGAAPASATFALVVHPSQAERQVEVSRHARPVASYQREVQQARAEARRCQEEKALLQAECGGRVGLRVLLTHGLIDEQGVLARDLSKEVVQHAGASLVPARAHSYRSATQRKVGKDSVLRLAVELRLENKGATSWKVADAALMGPKGEALRVLEVWQAEPIPPGKKRIVVVELEATEREARGTFTLKLRDEGGAQSVLLGGVTFP